MYRRPNIQGHPTPYLFDGRRDWVGLVQEHGRAAAMGLLGAVYTQVVLPGQAPGTDPLTAEAQGLTACNYCPTVIQGQDTGSDAAAATATGLTALDYKAVVIFGSENTEPAVAPAKGLIYCAYTLTVVAGQVPDAAAAGAAAAGLISANYATV